MASILTRVVVMWSRQVWVRGRLMASLAGTAQEPSMMDMADIARHLRQTVGGTKEFWSGETTRPTNLPPLEQPESQDMLPARCMADSFQVAYLPLGSDRKRREKYLNFYNMVRIGKILEDLDILAGWIAYLHIHGSKQELLSGMSPHTVVTALVDKIDLHDHAVLPDQDIKMEGNVTWAGRSSMEVTMRLSQLRADAHFKHLLDARFLMVSRDVHKGKAAMVNPLVAETPEEREIIQKGEENHVLTLDRWKTALTKVAPTAEESQIIHNLMLKSSLFDTSVKTSAKNKNDQIVMMGDTELSSLSICNPQQRNSHNKVFGGYLLRKAFGLAWASACLFCRTKPQFVAMDDIWFRRGVEIGSLIEFTSQVVYTPPEQTNRFQIMTVADVLDPGTGKRETTNVFYYTFESEMEVRPVAPRTYAEAMRYLDGKRRYDKGELLKGEEVV
ncbi:predicted protein [Nematostella vectensis]|uniref:HotDog ACOT-type domain-containing protein n=1 Tax=Nematostella vectensis TaxID=45351 RepID=A7RTL6_NEMVE|nr:predicted protein [Nematostella vectensis]|eukprot:XP_001637295.1 predicted protein [Nematostella vectensis]